MIRSRPIRSRLPALLLAAIAGACASPRSAAEPEWRDLFDGASLAGLSPIVFGGEGDVRVETGAILLEMGSPLSGFTVDEFEPPAAYELELVAARLDGTDFFCGLTFPVRDAHLTLILGGWGGSVCGLSSLDGEDASTNATRTIRSFPKGKDHHVRVRVSPESVDVMLDGEPFLHGDLGSHRLSLRPEVDLTRPLGFCCFSTRSRVRSLRWRYAPVRLL